MLIIEYKCQFCGRLFNNINDCADCMNNCYDPYIDIEIVNMYVCQYCNTKFSDIDTATKCEQWHEKFNKTDKFYNDYVTKKNFDNLKQAGNHKTQHKLI